MKPTWVLPEYCDPPHAVTHPGKLDELRAAFTAGGWHPERPALVGYEQGERIQLLTGSHRWRAAIDVGLSRIPVVLHTWERCYDAFGKLRRWQRLLAGVRAGGAPKAVSGGS